MTTRIGLVIDSLRRETSPGAVPRCRQGCGGGLSAARTRSRTTLRGHLTVDVRGNGGGADGLSQSVIRGYRRRPLLRDLKADVRMYRYSNPNRLPVQAVVAASKWFVRQRAVRLPIGAVELQLKDWAPFRARRRTDFTSPRTGSRPMTAWFNWVFPSLATLRARCRSDGWQSHGVRRCSPAHRPERVSAVVSRLGLPA